MNLNLINFGVQELNENDLEQTEGGFFYWLEMWGGLNFINNSAYGMSSGMTELKYG